MLKRIKSFLFVICVVMVFTAQTNRPDDKERKSGPAPRPSQTHQPVASHREAPQSHFQPAHQERAGPRVYAVVQSGPVENNNLFHQQHHKHWQPRYNFYDDQYHFYPYVNIASMVELSSGCVAAGFNGQNYYYDQGTFYLQDQGGQYVAIPPPVGIIVNPIAVNARQIIVNDQVFYRYKGVFYIQVAQGYQVIEPVQPVPADS